MSRTVPTASIAPTAPAWQRRLTAGRLLAWFALGAMLLLTVAPLAVMIKTALEPGATLFQQSDSVWPQAPTLDNFRRVLGLMTPEQSLALGGSGADIDFARATLNSLMFTTAVVTLQTTFCAMAGYSFARLRFPGRQVLFGAFLATMMVPGVVTFLPNFVLLRDLGWLNTWVGMLAPFALMSAFSVFFLRQFFLSMPRDVEEAARIDGANTAQIFLRIVLPLSTTPLATIALLTGLGAWNEFFWPYLVARDESMQVVPVALQTFKGQTPQGQPDWTGLMAAATVAVLPALALLVVLGRKVVEAVQYGGGK